MYYTILTRPDRLTELAPELSELILSYLEPRDLTSFGRTCHRAQSYVQPGNKTLWRSAFLHVFDHPKHAWEALQPTARADVRQRERELSWDWYLQVRTRYSAYNAVCAARNGAVRSPEHVVKALLDVFETAFCSKESDADHSTSLNITFLDRLFRVAPGAEKIVHDYDGELDSVYLPLESLDEDSLPRQITPSTAACRISVPEWASRFHIYYGMTERETESLSAKSSARAIVYDWAVTGASADWGPLLKDGSGNVNWLSLEAITSLMHRNFDLTRGSKYLNPSGFRNNVLHSLAHDPLFPADWAGVTRMWVGTYAFLDYRALVHFNFTNNSENPIDLGNYEEACGDLMRLHLHIVDDEDFKHDPRFDSDLPYCKDLPKVYFEGQTGGHTTGRVAIYVRGTACLTPGARQVRWRFIISYSDADQWQLEGVQPGGIRSGGIYGLWSHVDHDEHGPMGPFFYAPYDICKPSRYPTS